MKQTERDRHPTKTRPDQTRRPLIFHPALPCPPNSSRQENGFLFLVAWYRWSWFIAPFQGLELTSRADVRMRTLIRAREMGPDGLPICQSCDGCFADTITVNSITVTLCFYPEALSMCWHILVCMCLFQLSVTDKLSDGIVLCVVYCSLTSTMAFPWKLEELE